MKKYQGAITRFRSSSHRLGIELGRHQKPYIPVDERICKFCNLGEIDDEYHFLVHCELNANSRAVLYSDKRQYIVDLDRLEDGERFKQMFISNDKEALQCLGKFIHDGFRLRDLLQETDFRWITYFTERFCLFVLFSCINFSRVLFKSFILNHGAYLLMEMCAICDYNTVLKSCFIFILYCVCCTHDHALILVIPASYDEFIDDDIPPPPPPPHTHTHTHTHHTHTPHITGHLIPLIYASVEPTQLTICKTACIWNAWDSTAYEMYRNGSISLWA